MIKKSFVLLVLIVLVTGGAFAQDISAGAGIFFGGDLGGGFQASEYGFSIKEEISNSGFGFFGFLDIGYLEASIGFLSGSGEIFYQESALGYGSDSFIMYYDFSSLHLSLLAKYPVNMGNMTVFPAVGIDYQMVNKLEVEGFPLSVFGFDESDFSALWIRFGGGLDYQINDNLFIRGTALYGIRMQNQYEQDNIAYIQQFGVSASAIVGNGFQIKAAVGYRF
jgi:hypothetical protein